MVNEDTLRARYSLVDVDDEGVLLDRESGAVLRLNSTACVIWAGLIGGDSPATIAAALVRRFGIAAEIAERDVHAALVELPADEASRSRGEVQESTGFLWEESPGGYVFREHGVVTCEVDRLGATLRLAPGARPTLAEARGRIRSVVARVLALRGIHLLHASAVEIEGATTVFTGPSGAGKTTTARAFARTGARLISEDLLVLAPAARNRRAVEGGEATIRRWIAERAAQLAAHPDEGISCEDLDHSVDGDHLPIDRIVLLNARRRTGGQIHLKALSRPDALVALMDSVYFASADTATWDERFETLRGLVAIAVTSEAVMPIGVMALDSAVSEFRHSAMIAS